MVLSHVCLMNKKDILNVQLVSQVKILNQKACVLI